jgi:hypothetical protein
MTEKCVGCDERRKKLFDFAQNIIDNAITKRLFEEGHIRSFKTGWTGPVQEINSKTAAEK